MTWRGLVGDRNTRPKLLSYGERRHWVEECAARAHATGRPKRYHAYTKVDLSGLSTEGKKLLWNMGAHCNSLECHRLQVPGFCFRLHTPRGEYEQPSTPEPLKEKSLQYSSAGIFIGRRMVIMMDYSDIQ